MLDLNLSVVSQNSGKLSGSSRMESSGTGSFNSSSVVNTTAGVGGCAGGGDDDSTSNYDAAFGYSFSILRKDKELDVVRGGGEEEEEEDEDDCGVRNDRTIQLFPVAGDGAVSDVAGWLDLTSTFGEAAEQRIVPQRQQQQQKPLVKKSRRGPRSRSSQYRGVTFYRRTGRWESHIWSVISSQDFYSFGGYYYYYFFLCLNFDGNDFIYLFIYFSIFVGIVESKFTWVRIIKSCEVLIYFYCLCFLINLRVGI